jgi:hypothetical protein
VTVATVAPAELVTVPVELSTRMSACGAEANGVFSVVMSTTRKRRRVIGLAVVFLKRR